MERQITTSMLSALTSDQCLYIYGPPCIGKTFSALELANKSGYSYIYLDLNTDKEFLNACHTFLQSDSLDFVGFLSSFFSFGLDTVKKTLFILDGFHILSEVESARLYFCSLPSRLILLSYEPFLGTQTPNQFSSFLLRPLSFYEFLDATNHHWYQEVLTAHYKTHEEIPSLITIEINQLLADYLLVGGYPQAIEKYLVTKCDIQMLHSVHKQLYSTIVYQFGLLATSKYRLSLTKLQQFLDLLAASISNYKTAPNFSFIRRGATQSQFADEINLLVHTGFITRVVMNNKDIHYEISDCGLQRYLATDYDLFMTLENNEDIPIYAMQTYVYEEFRNLSQAELHSWHSERSAYLSLLVDTGKCPIAIHCGSKSSKGQSLLQYSKTVSESILLHVTWSFQKKEKEMLNNTTYNISYCEICEPLI